MIAEIMPGVVLPAGALRGDIAWGRCARFSGVTEPFVGPGKGARLKSPEKRSQELPAWV